MRDLFIGPDVNGGVVRDWYFASVDLTDPPGWLRRNSGVSWSHIALRTRAVGEMLRLLRGVITEVSILHSEHSTGGRVRRRLLGG